MSENKEEEKKGIRHYKIRRKLDDICSTYMTCKIFNLLFLIHSTTCFPPTVTAPAISPLASLIAGDRGPTAALYKPRVPNTITIDHLDPCSE